MQDPPVTSLMTEPVLTVQPDESPSGLAEGMVELGIKSVVVTDGESHPEGIITSTDYLRMAAEGVDPAETTVAEWMSTDIITLTANQKIDRAADLMRDNDINHLPIVDGAGETIGIVTATDLTAYLAEDD